MIADPQNLIPPNSGCWRPVRVTAPPGSVVNAQPPAPVVYANHEVSHRGADMVMATHCLRLLRISERNRKFVDLYGSFSHR
jgi:N-methylhydantoinase B/oxoprolinase/acetone carboxylase alpha subunit